jgi:hypothetical protein
MKLSGAERPTHLVRQVGDADTLRHCAGKLFVDEDEGQMLVEDNGSCLSLFVYKLLWSHHQASSLRSTKPIRLAWTQARVGI